MNGMIIRILMAFSVFPVVALFTHDPVTIVVAGTIAGVFVYFVTWAIQLAIRNKELPVVRPRKKKKSSFEDDIFEDYVTGDGTYGQDSPGFS